MAPSTGLTMSWRNGTNTTPWRSRVEFVQKVSPLRKCPRRHRKPSDGSTPLIKAMLERDLIRLKIGLSTWAGAGPWRPILK
jgi:hypothetical protein